METNHTVHSPVEANGQKVIRTKQTIQKQDIPFLEQTAVRQELTQERSFSCSFSSAWGELQFQQSSRRRRDQSENPHHGKSRRRLSSLGLGLRVLVLVLRSIGQSQHTPIE